VFLPDSATGKYVFRGVLAHHGTPDSAYNVLREFLILRTASDDFLSDDPNARILSKKMNLPVRMIGEQYVDYVVLFHFKDGTCSYVVRDLSVSWYSAGGGRMQQSVEENYRMMRKKLKEGFSNEIMKDVNGLLDDCARVIHSSSSGSERLKP
jgi:hypothetical protein